MTTSKPQPGRADVLAALAWAAVALTPVGWFYGVLNIAYSHLGDVTDVSMMTAGVVLFVAAPTAAAVLAAYAARAGQPSGKIAVIVSGLLLLATIVALLVYGGWIGLGVAVAAAALVLAWVRFRSIAAVVSGLLLLAIFAFAAWQSGGWVNVAVMAVVAVLGFAWARFRNKPPSGPDSVLRGKGSPGATAPPGASGRR